MINTPQSNKSNQMKQISWLGITQNVTPYCKLKNIIKAILHLH